MLYTGKLADGEICEGEFAPCRYSESGLVEVDVGEAKPASNVTAPSVKASVDPLAVGPHAPAVVVTHSSFPPLIVNAGSAEADGAGDGAELEPADGVGDGADDALALGELPGDGDAVPTGK